MRIAQEVSAMMLETLINSETQGGDAPYVYFVRPVAGDVGRLGPARGCGGADLRPRCM